MSDAPSQMPRDPTVGPFASVRRPPTRTIIGNMPDRAAVAPPGGSYDQVVIAPRPAIDDRDIERIITVAFQEAKIYDDRLQIARAAAFRLYNGEPMGDEEPGRSQIVLTEVRDTIAALMPTMMRVFSGADRPVEFAPVRDGDENEARQAEDYVQHVTFVENDGWSAIHDAIMDAMQLKVGWIHWFWDYQSDTKAEHFYGLLPAQCEMLVSQPGVTALRVVRRAATPQERAGILASPEARGLDPRLPILVFDAQISRKSPRNRPRLCAVPSEQVLIDTDATGPNDPQLRFIGRWRITTVGDLVAQGFDRDLVMTRVTQLQQQTNRVTRRRDRLSAIVPRQQSPDPALWRIRHLECWARFDHDGDGIAELHHLHLIGDYSFRLIAHEPASRVPLARICPFRVPHRAIGESVADRVGDLQRAMTRVFRNILDSMAESIHPRTVIEEGYVTPDDVFNTEMGAVIRERKPGAVRELVKPFVGPSALPVMEALGVIKESRTGVTRTSQGLTADVLQSTTPIAVSAQIAASADRIELIIRTIAQGIRDLYAGLLSLLVEHQDRPRVVPLRGVWTPVDPRAWVAGFNVVVKDAVGAGSMLQRIQVLGQIATQQKELLTTLGPNNPLCSLGQLRNTLADMADCAGITNIGRYFNPLPANYVYQPPPPPPSPDQIIAQAEATKATSQAQSDAEKVNTDRWTALLEDDRMRDESRAKYVLEALDLAGKYGTQIDLHGIGALMARNPVSLPARNLSAPVTPPQPPPVGPGAAAGGSGGGAPPSPNSSAASVAPGGGAGGGAPPMGLAQRLFLPPPLITALSAANRMPSSALAAAPPILAGIRPPAAGMLGARPGMVA